MQYLDSLVARATNASLGRCEGLWSSDVSYSAVAHGAQEDVVSKASYVLANPVAAGLVAHAREWPGLWSAPEQLGTAMLAAQRPAFFRANGVMPERAELALSVPPGFASAEEFRERVAAATSGPEAEHRRSRQAERRGFMGRARVLAQRPSARPPPDEPRRGLNPRVAARDPQERIEKLSDLSEFLRGYREALAAFRAGIRDVVFPAGTYLLRVLHGVRCAAA